MAQKKITAAVHSQAKLADGIFSMWLEAQEMAKEAVPGQFISVYTADKSKILPRPISICETDKENGRLRIVYRVAGAGTEEFSAYGPGDTVEIMGPLGNGFPLLSGKRAMLIGGGIGIPPMLELAKCLDGEKTAVLGYRDASAYLFLKEEIGAYAKTAVATEDGSVGTKGTVIDAIKEQGLSADVIYACGPTPMLKAIKAYALEHGIECYLSLEERMACGIGACLACVCQSKDRDHHSNVYNKRVCKDGPVFKAEEIEFLTQDEQRARNAAMQLSGCGCGQTASDANKEKED